MRPYRSVHHAAVACFVTVLSIFAPCDAGTKVALASNMRAPSTDLFEVLRARHSIRAYEKRAVEQEKLVKILEAARSAPSAGNLQAYEIVVAQEQATRDKLTRAAFGQAFISEAPVVLVFVTDPERSEAKYGNRGEKLYSVQDAAIAASYAQLAATALGLGSVWVGAFDEARVLAAVGASRPRRAVSLLVIGYPNEAPEATSRRPLSNLVRRETLDTKWGR